MNFMYQGQSLKNKVIILACQSIPSLHQEEAPSPLIPIKVTDTPSIGQMLAGYILLTMLQPAPFVFNNKINTS